MESTQKKKPSLQKKESSKMIDLTSENNENSLKRKRSESNEGSNKKQKIENSINIIFF